MQKAVVLGLSVKYHLTTSDHPRELMKRTGQAPPRPVQGEFLTSLFLKRPVSGELLTHSTLTLSCSAANLASRLTACFQCTSR